MRQADLEQKVRELFERQGFNVEKESGGFRACNGKEMVLKAFSSENYSIGEVEENVESGDLVFVDPELSELQEVLENEVSVLREEEEKPDYETPSYEVIGDIAVINDLAGVEEEEAVSGILHHQPHVETVLLKEDGLSGEFRVGDYRKLHGDETETVHTEHGCKYLVDPTQVYFSERFATERERVVSQIEPGEKVLVMFAGVGPFAIMAAKKAEPGKVVAVEKNPAGADYLKRNIELNNVEDTVEGVEGDVAEVVPGLGKFDRVIMPLPESSHEFLPLALEHLEDNGVVHYYRFLENGDWELLEREVARAARDTGIDYEILDKVVCGQRAANIDRVCLEVKKVK